VGDRLTLADLAVFNILIPVFTFTYDAGFCKAMPNVAAWFAKLSKLPIVARTAGYVKIAGGAGAAKPQAAPVAAEAKEGKKAKGGKKGKKEEPKKVEVAAEEDEFDPFAEVEDVDPEAEAKAAAELKAKAIAAKKKKTPPIAKSIVLLEVKPWGPETDLDTLGKKIIADIAMDGLVWKTEYKKEPVAYGVFKIIIGMVVEDAKVSVDDVIEQIESFDEFVQSVDIAAFNKL